MTGKYCSAFEYLAPHQTLLDHINGCNVCTACGLVLDEGLGHTELHLKKVPEERKACNVTTGVMIDGDSAVKYLNKVGDGLHLCQSTINNAFDNYRKAKVRMRTLMTLQHQHKSKRILLNDKNLIVYALYNTLKQESCPRPITEICWNAGNIPHANIYAIEKFFQVQSKHEDNLTPRLKPITAKDIVYSHYTYVKDLTFHDVKQIQHLLNVINSTCNFSALVTAAGIVFLYMKYIKKSKVQSLQQMSNLFRVTTMSIRRFVSKYKLKLCPIN